MNIRRRKKTEKIQGSDYLLLSDGASTTVPDRESLWLGMEVDRALSFTLYNDVTPTEVWQTEKSNEQYKIVSTSYCSTCRKVMDFVYSSKIDPSHVDDKDWMFSCRGVASDYRTCECVKCGYVRTFDFARD